MKWISQLPLQLLEVPGMTVEFKLRIASPRLGPSFPASPACMYMDYNLEVHESRSIQSILRIVSQSCDCKMPPLSRSPSRGRDRSRTPMETSRSPSRRRSISPRSRSRENGNRRPMRSETRSISRSRSPTSRSTKVNCTF